MKALVVDGSYMTLVRLEIKKKINFVLGKMHDITRKYPDNKPVDIKDIEDMRRYSEILINLQTILNNSWSE